MSKEATARSAMKLALEALEISPMSRKNKDAIDTLREALNAPLAEQPAPAQQCMDHGECFGGKCIYPAPLPAQQEPVVWMYVNKSTHETKFQKHMRDFVDHSLWSEVPLYGEPLANHELQCVCGAVWCGDEMVHLPDKHPPAQRKPLPYNKDDMEGLDINQRLGFKLGWKSAEEAHGIKENT